MATLSEIAKKIVEEYNENYNTLSLSDIAKEINSLTYTQTTTPLSDEDKKKLLDLIQFKFQYGADKEYGDTLLLGESEDSSNFIELVKALQKLVIK